MPTNVITGRSISDNNATFSEYHNGYIRADQARYLRYTNADGESTTGYVHESAVAASEQFIVGGTTCLASEAVGIPNLPLGLRLFYKADTTRDHDLMECTSDADVPVLRLDEELLNLGFTFRTEGAFRNDGGVIRATEGENRGREYSFVHIPMIVGDELKIVKTPFLATTIFRSRFIKFGGQSYFTSKAVFEQLIANQQCVQSDREVYLSIDDAIADGNVPTCYACDYHASHYDEAFNDRNREQLNNENIKFRVGFEIEKVDKVAKFKLGNMNYKKTLPSGTRIVVEQDSSLQGVGANRGGGFEAVTTIFDLFGDDIINDCDHPYFNLLLDAKATSVNPSGTNGEYNFEAGGHVNLSVSGMTTDELNKALEPFSGLLYACHARNLRRYANFQDKSRFNRGSVYDGTPAFENKYNGLMEIRLFGPVRSVEGFKARVELLRAICTLIEAGNVKNYLDVNRILRDRNTPLAKAAAAELAHVEQMFNEALGEDLTPEADLVDTIRKRAMLFSAAMDAQNFGLSKAKFGVFADRAQKQLADVYDSLHETTKRRMRDNLVSRETLFS